MSEAVAFGAAGASNSSEPVVNSQAMGLLKEMPAEGKHLLWLAPVPPTVCGFVPCEKFEALRITAWIAIERTGADR